jgi:hypothetical protein
MVVSFGSDYQILNAEKSLTVAKTSLHSKNRYNFDHLLCVLAGVVEVLKAVECCCRSR